MFELPDDRCDFAHRFPDYPAYWGPWITDCDDGGHLVERTGPEGSFGQVRYGADGWVIGTHGGCSGGGPCTECCVVDGQTVTVPTLLSGEMVPCVPLPPPEVEAEPAPVPTASAGCASAPDQGPCWGIGLGALVATARRRRVRYSAA